MARPLRIEHPGAVYRVTSRGNAHADIFLSDADRKTFLDVLAATVEKYNWLCHAYCLLGNHYHAIIETPDPNLSPGMRQLNGVYTQAFNRGHQRVGHVFQGRYKAILVEKGSQLLELCRYVVLNPVRAGLVVKPEQWQWSSYKSTAYAGKTTGFLTVDWVLKQFAKKRTEARQRYRRFIADGLKEQTSPWQKVTGQIFLGSENFVARMRGLLGDRQEIKEIPWAQRYPGRSMEKADWFFHRHGHISTFIGRLLPGIRQYISLPAGLARMNFFVFCWATVFGAGLWVTVLAAVGYWFGRNEQLVLRNLHWISVGLLMLSAGLVAVYWRNRVRAAGKQGKEAGA